MCLGKPKTVKAPPVQAPPSRDEQGAAVQDQRRRASQQQGVYGSIFTNVLGDPTYNTSVKAPSAVATIGA